MARWPPVATVGEGRLVEGLVAQHLVVSALGDIGAPDEPAHLRLPGVDQQDPLGDGIVGGLRQVQAVPPGQVALLEPQQGAGRLGDCPSLLWQSQGEQQELGGAAADCREECDGSLFGDVGPVLAQLRHLICVEVQILCQRPHEAQLLVLCVKREEELANEEETSGGDLRAGFLQQLHHLHPAALQRGCKLLRVERPLQGRVGAREPGVGSVFGREERGWWPAVVRAGLQVEGPRIAETERLHCRATPARRPPAAHRRAGALRAASRWSLGARTRRGVADLLGDLTHLCWAVLLQNPAGDL
mmetsp:Transcript_82169/g.259286  ORF Transcript_82169/g.259286 Transcript_82169/m.259286 type:complete len:301 (-) Transcript_82169:820-1722(-)